LLVLLTFVTFLLIDHFYSRKHAVQPVLQVAPSKHEAARLQPGLVGGFQVPENLRYHPGHTWALNESPSLVRVGMDDFASKLLGGALARWWTEESASRLQRKMPMALGALAQDGGVAMDNLTAQIPDQDWMELAKEFFLS